MDRFQPALDMLDAFVKDPANHDILSMVKAARNGIVYGTKVRFPHALVMVFLFGSGSLRSKVLKVLSATRQHATNLATFALLYKTLTILSRRKPALVPHVPDALKQLTHSPLNPAHAAPSYTPFLAGAIAGYFVFGRHPSASAVNQQIVIYVFARVMLALAKLLILAPQPGPQGFQAGYEGIGLAGGMGSWVDTLCGGDKDMAEMWRKRIRKNTWPVFASASWGAVMWMFTWYPELLQPSMRSSMRYLYVECEKWEGWRTWIWRSEA